MNDKVLLIALPAVTRSEDRYLDDGHSFHLGLAYLGGILRKNKFSVKILDCFAEAPHHIRPVLPEDDGWCEYGLSDESIIEKIQDFSPSIIGMSIPFSCQHYVAEKIGRKIKDNFPNVRIVAGGNHVTALPEALDRNIFDFLVIGEGEFIFLELIRALMLGQATNHIRGIFRGDEICQEFIENLDELPFPAIDLLPLQKLWKSGKRWINMVATRGCVYDCVFCSIHTIMGYKIRKRSIDNVIAEIKHWKKEYEIKEVYFEDDNLTTDKKWAKELFKKIAECKFGIRFFARNGIRADSIDRELLTLMKKAGFHDFMISPESGSQRTLDEIIGKHMKLEDCERAVTLAKEVGLGVNTFFVIGFPQETMEDLEKTLAYALHLKERGCVGFWVSTATPYPGTRFFKDCVSKGIIKPGEFDFRKLRTVDYVMDSPNFSSNELLEFRDKMVILLAPPKVPFYKKGFDLLKLLNKDPSFFMMKVKYKLGL